MKNLEKYADFGGQADISVAGVQNLTDEIDFLETQRNAYRAELMAERLENKELLASFLDLLPSAKSWAQVMQDVEALLAYSEVLEERVETLSIEVKESQPSASLFAENQAAVYAMQCLPKPLIPFASQIIEFRSAS